MNVKVKVAGRTVLSCSFAFYVVWRERDLIGACENWVDRIILNATICDYPQQKGVMKYL